MCDHSYVTEVKTYFDKEKKCKVRIETDTCIFCGKKGEVRRIYSQQTNVKRKLPYFGPHLK